MNTDNAAFSVGSNVTVLPGAEHHVGESGHVFMHGNDGVIVVAQESATNRYAKKLFPVKVECLALKAE